LAKLDEDLIIGDKTCRLGTNEFQGKLFPEGYQLQKEFALSPFPTFTYQAQGIVLTKTVFMPQNKNAVIVLYNSVNKTDFDAEIRIFPMVTCRHFHSVVNHLQKPLDFQKTQDQLRTELGFSAPKATLVTDATVGEFVEKPNWVERLRYREEGARGEIDVDDCYQTGYYSVQLKANRETVFAIAAAAGEKREDAFAALGPSGFKLPGAERLLTTELENRSLYLDGIYRLHAALPANNWLNWLLLATDTFVATDVINQKSILAGYFWFESWGRDAFISLPGLLLVTGRYEDAKQVLLNFSRYCKNGLIPNIILDKSGQALYDTVDGTLWYLNAVLQYLKYTGDFEFVQENLWSTLKSVIESHECGTAFGIRLDSDGLLAHGSRLTWMDASVDGKAVTPRAGKAVEIQALWYNALKIMQLLAKKFEENALSEKYAAMADQTRRSLAEKFWNNQTGCLFDVVGEHCVDASLRPNQIIAASLDFRALDESMNRRIVDFVQADFLTPSGLRTLSRSDPQYKGSYMGTMRQRDQAYHNGTVWPWLLGPLTTAFIRSNGCTSDNINFASNNFIKPLFEKQVAQAGLGTISEIFNGDPPHTPQGCIAQAWSVAEPLRAYVEDVLQIRPKYENVILQLAEQGSPTNTA
jgi:predicted glycogen debranching enzyme